MLQQTIEEQDQHFRWHRRRKQAMTPRRLLRESDDLRYSHDSVTSLDALIERARECGLDRIALTDHNTAEGALELAKLAPELTIIGEEAKTREGEVIGLFITRRVPPYLRPEEAMDLIHEMGGLTYIPHPLDRNRSHFRSERIVELADRIDIIETYNPWAEPGANRAASELAAER